MPKTEPRKGATKNVRSMSFQPKSEPIMASSLTSPPPMASLLKTILPKIAVAYMIPPPATMPFSEAINPPMAELLPCKKGNNKLKNAPTTIPDTLIESGISLKSKSIKVTAMRLAKSAE